MDTLPKQEERIKRLTVTMPCHLGLHARTAVLFINFAKEFNSTIRTRKGKHVVNGKSILGLLTLGVAFNSKLEIEVEGDDAREPAEDRDRCAHTRGRSGLVHQDSSAQRPDAHS